METVKTRDGVDVVEFDLRNHIEDGILREEPFFAAMNNIEWQEFSGRSVLVKACGTGPLPPWAFMLVASKLVGYVDGLYYGNASDPVLIFSRENA